jgi:uncharacterized protein YndB with AHSA1/START domain
MTETAVGEVRITRVFDAPRELVFRAWIDPDQIARWWGPLGWGAPRETVEIEPRAGGRYHVRMVEDATGTAHATRGEILELVEPELIVIRNEPLPEIGLTEHTVTRVELHDEGGKTRLTLTDGPYTGELRDLTEAGWTEQLGKLDELVAGSG